jgi:hypothetical protein
MPEVPAFFFNPMTVLQIEAVGGWCQIASASGIAAESDFHAA